MAQKPWGPICVQISLDLAGCETWGQLVCFSKCHCPQLLNIHSQVASKTPSITTGDLCYSGGISGGYEGVRI